ALGLSPAAQPMPEGDTRAREEALAASVRDVRLDIAPSRPMLLQAISRAAGGGEEGQEFAMFAALILESYIAQLEEQGLVRVEDERSVMSVLYQNGEVNLNGQTMPVDEFLYLVSAFSL